MPRTPMTERWPAANGLASIEEAVGAFSLLRDFFEGAIIVDAQTRIILQDELLRIWGQDRPATERRTVVFITHAIDEAVFLADRVAVMTTHPGRLKAVIDVDLPRPRGDATRAHPQFQALSQHIWSLIRDEAYRATVT